MRVVCAMSGGVDSAVAAARMRDLGHEVVDFGAYDENACDLPDVVYPAALALSRRHDDLCAQLLAWHALARSLEASGRPARLAVWWSG